MFKTFRKFIPFAKVEEQKDGTLYVYGLVTAEKPDQENEVCDYESTKPFYQKLVSRYAKATAAVEGMEQSIAPLREMHQLKAVGCGKAIEFDDDKKTISMGFHVVESEACKKVKAGVLIGFSQGGDYVKQWQKGKFTWYTADPGEVSLVDSPCLEDALIQQLVEKTFTYVQENGSTELRKFQVSKPAAKVPARDGSLTRAEKIDRVRKMHGVVALAMQKSMYDVKTVADILQSLRSTCSWLADEKAFEDDDSPVPDKLKGILSQLATVFIELATEEANELVEAAKVAKGAITTMKPELLAKLKDLGKGTVSLTKDEMEALAGLADKLDVVEKAGKSVVAHLQSMHKAVQEHHDGMVKAAADHMAEMHESIGKCAKALGTFESGAGAITGGKEAAGGVTFTKEQVDKAVADALAKAKETPVVPPPPGTLTQADLDKAVEAALAKAATDKTKLTLVPRPGQETKRPETPVVPGEGDELAKSAGF
jgi:hypothetical protein